MYWKDLKFDKNPIQVDPVLFGENACVFKDFEKMK